MSPLQASNKIYLTFALLLLVVVGQSQARAFQDDLPPLVSTEGEPVEINPKASKEIPAPDAPAAAPEAPEPKGKKDEPQQQQQRPTESPSKPLDSHEETKDKKQDNETSQEIDKASSTPAAAASPPQEEEEHHQQPAPADDPPKDEKDLKSLLESKNDAENDLAGAGSSTESNMAKEQQPAKGGAPSDEVPVSVVADNSKPANDERFHYSLAGSPSVASANKSPAATENNADKADADDDTQDDLEVKKEEKKPASASPPVSAEEFPEKKIEGPTAKVDPPIEPKRDQEPTKESSATAGSPPVIPSTEATGAPTEPKNQEEKPKNQEQPEEVKPAPESTSTTKPKEGEAKKPDEVAASPQAPAVGEKPGSSHWPEVASEQSSSTAAAQTESQPTTSTTTPTPTTTTISAMPSSSTQAAEASSSSSAKTEAPKLAAPPSGLDVPAVRNPAAAAAGAAAGSAIGSSLSSKDKTSTASSSSGSGGSTKAPTTARKSTTNKWNSWPTPSSTTPPPARRRPILPSIRRRFRPYNPFPWSRPESYSPFEPVADTEPEFGPSSLQPAFGSTTYRPRPRSSTTTSTTSQPRSSSAKPIDSDSALDEEMTPNVTHRRNPSSREGSGSGSGRKRHPDNHHHHRHHYHSDSSDYPSNRGDSEFSSPPKRYNNNNHRNNRDRPGQRHHRHNEDRTPFLGGGGPGSSFGIPFRPTSSLTPSFGLFNNAGGSGIGSPSTGSGFDLLNPFSWIDEMTRPRPPLHSQRPPLGGLDGLGSGGGRESRPTPTHIGSAGRPSGQGGMPFEGEYGGPGMGREESERPHISPHHHGHDHRAREHDHHNEHHHRPHVNRPVGSGPTRDDYDDYHDCHGRGHGHDQDHDYEHHHGRPYRPPYGHASGSRPVYDEYGSGGRRPGERPFNRRDESPAGGRETESQSEGERDREPTIRSGGPSAGADERVESELSSSRPQASAAGPRRMPSSAFSPFDTLFGSLDDDLFGGLRSSFIDTPLKVAADTLRQSQNTAFDAIISSPKISLPNSSGVQKPPPSLTQDPDTAQSSRVILGPQATESTGKAQRSKGWPDGSVEFSTAGGSGGEPGGKLRVFIDRLESVRAQRQMLSKLSQEQPQSAVGLPPPTTRTLRGGIKHFLLMI